MYGKFTEKVRVLVNTNILSSGTGTGTGSFPLRVRKYGRGTGYFELRGVRKKYGKKSAKFLVWVRVRVRITFSFISTGTDSVPVPALRGMVCPHK